MLSPNDPGWNVVGGWSAAVAAGAAVGAAVAFYPLRGRSGLVRTLAWLVCAGAVALSPCLVPADTTGRRLAVTLLAIAVLVKLYDILWEPAQAQRLGLPSYVAYLPNGFWLVLRREPPSVAPRRDLANLARRVPACAFAGLVATGLWWCDWSAVPFAVEHALKVSAVVQTIVLAGNAGAAAYRLFGGRALDPMANPIAAHSPADFWRRWNRPAQQFLATYVFSPSGGFRRAARSTLVTFGVSGLLHEYVFGIATGRVVGEQLLFFMIQGCAVVATLRVRPSKRARPLCIAGTLAFNLATSVLFFRSVNAVLPFYWPRPGRL